MIDVQAQITQVVAMVLATVITAVVSWVLVQIRAHVTDKRMLNAIDVFVDAAEQKLAGASGPEKLTWVTNLALKQFPRANPAIVRAMIEASVHGLDQGLIEGQAVTIQPPTPGTPVPAPDPEALIQEVLTRVMTALQAGLTGGKPTA